MHSAFFDSFSLCVTVLGPWVLGTHGIPLLGGSWVVISGVISKVTIVITHTRGLITILITTHEPPSNGSHGKGFRDLGFWGIFRALGF